MHYLAKIVCRADGFRAEFPDVPGCQVAATDEQEVVVRARDALASRLRADLAAGISCAPRRRDRRGGRAIEVPGDVAFAIDLREARAAAGLSRATLAQRAGVTEQLVEQLEMARGVAALDVALPIANVLGLRLTIELERPGVAVGLVGPGRRTSMRGRRRAGMAVRARLP